MAGPDREDSETHPPPSQRPHFLDRPDHAYCERLAAEVFKTAAVVNGGSECLRLGTREFKTKDELCRAMEQDAKLQYLAAVASNYVPSKWLLEQELRAKMRRDGRQTCISSDEIGLRDVYDVAAQEELTGVCLSGGGIRSATFNLGVLQGLAQLGILPFIDYLSSVSGGGYIHEFFAAWTLREPGGLRKVAQKMIPQAEPGCPPRSPEEIRWLQRYSSYLTPKRGILSADTWTLFAIWLRNTTLNQIPIVTFLATALFVINLLVQQPLNGEVSFKNFLSGRGEWSTLIVGLLLGCASLCAIWLLALDLRRQTQLSHIAPEPEPREESEAHKKKRIERLNKKRELEGRLLEKLLGNGKVQAFIVLPWLGLSVWATFWCRLQFGKAVWWTPWMPWIGGAMVLVVALVLVFAGGALEAFKAHTGVAAARPSLAMLGFSVGASGATGVACAMAYVFQLSSLKIAEFVSGKIGNLGVDAEKILVDPWRIQIVLLPALFLSVPYIAMELTIGILGRDYADSRREWLARLRAWSMLYATVWMGLTAIALLAPYVVSYLISKGHTAEFSAFATYVIAHLVTIIAGWSEKSDGKPKDNSVLGYRPADLLAMLAAPIAILSLLVVLSFGVTWLASFLVQSPHCIEIRNWIGAHALLEFLLGSGDKELLSWKPVLLACAAFAALIAGVFGRRVDINEFSMLSFYRNRLGRCYLGATIPNRRPDPFTGFDVRNRVQTADQCEHANPPLLKDLLPENFRWEGRPPGKYDGPFPILCTTLNLTTGGDLASQERKGTSFAFTPMYSGYSVGWTDAKKNARVSLNGYVPTPEYAYRNGGIHLDTVAAISGAALNPNQGYNSNPALAFIMTFFNVRLGWWITNPRKANNWRSDKIRATPKFALKYLLLELFGAVNDASNYVNLSDGGHFENMGLYELVRRRCKFIIVCDAEQDADVRFCGMGNAINRCRADFGAEIDLDFRPLQKQPNGCSKAHCVVGTIHYPPPRQGTKTEGATTSICECLGEKSDDCYKGTILYIKTSLVGDEPSDLLAYQLQHEEFPQDSTANQWFTETQFESYRRLGHHIAMTAIRPALQPDQDEVKSQEEISNLFNCLYSVWYPPTPEMEKHLGDHLKQYEAILSELRARTELIGLAEALNDKKTWAEADELTWNGRTDADEQYARQFANSVLNFMYTVYTNLQLAFPGNRVSPHAGGWVCLFRRWSRVTLLRGAWTALKPIYSEEFQLFARRELRLP